MRRVHIALISVGVSTACTSVEKVDEISRGDETRSKEPEAPATRLNTFGADASVAPQSDEAMPTAGPPSAPRSPASPTPATEPTLAGPEPQVLPAGPTSEPSAIDNTGVWIHGGYLAARGTGSEWEYYATGQVYYAGIWGSSMDDAWVVGTSAAHFQRGQVVLESASWQSGVEPLITELWGTSAKDIWGWGLDSVVVHFDGVSWKQVDDAPERPIPAWTSATLPADFPGPFQDAEGASNDIWAVGYETVEPQGAVSPSGDGPILPHYRGYVFHFDGTTWTDVTPPLLRECLEMSDCAGENRRLAKVWIAPERYASTDAGVSP